MTVEAVFRQEWKVLWEETLLPGGGHYLDRGTSLAETLGALSAAQASRPAASNGETIAAHVVHLVFYLDIVAEYVERRRTEMADWPSSWKETSVDEARWAELQARLKDRCTEWNRRCDEGDLGDAELTGALLGVLVHTGFHLGAIRQLVDGLR